MKLSGEKMEHRSMKSILEQAIKKSKKEQTINWNYPRLKRMVSGEFVDYMENRKIENQGNKRCHGYFSLLHNIVQNLGDNSLIVELGNREGLSTISIMDALRNDGQFISFDIIKDLRFFPPELWSDKRFTSIQCDVGDHFAVETHMKSNTDRTIDLLFCDTIHTYDQVRNEFDVFEEYLSPSAIVLVDDIHNNDKYRFHEEWVGDKYDVTDPMHYPTGFGAYVYQEDS